MFIASSARVPNTCNALRVLRAPKACATMQFNKYSGSWLSPKSAVSPAHGGDSRQRPTNNTWRSFSIVVCTAVCVLQIKQTWLQTCWGCWRHAIPANHFRWQSCFFLAFYHQNLTVFRNCARDITTDKLFQKTLICLITIMQLVCFTKIVISYFIGTHAQNL